jgi:two-component system, response regulator YesN
MDMLDQLQNEGNEVRHEHHRVEKIKLYISGNLKNDLSITVVSQKFDLSPSTLQHIFKKHQHQSYRRYIEETRMNKAMELLKEGKWIKEIMNATGYKYRGTFNMAFKRKFKHPPGYFRK